MGKINQGILGGFRGKVGNVIGGNWKGIDYMRVKPTSVANPKTPGQVGQRTKFSAILQLLQPMKDHIKIGYKNFAIKKTEFNSAMSYNLNNAIVGEHPNISIDYSKVLVSRGKLAEARDASSSSNAIGQIQINWSDNSDESSANSNDKVFLLVYNKSKGESISIVSDIVRTAESLDLELPDSFHGDAVEVFLSFISDDENTVSDSKYAGEVIVTAD